MSSLVPPDLAATFSPDDAALRADPWPVYDRLRADGPVAWLPGLKSFAVFSYATVHAVLSGRDFTAEHQFRASRRAVGPTILDVEDPGHRRLRHLIHPPLGQSSVRANRSSLRAVIDSVLDGLPVNEPIDLMAEIAEVLPMRVVCQMLGLPAASAPWLAVTSRPLADYLDETGTSLAEARRCRETLIDYLDENFFAAKENDSPLGRAMLESYRSGEFSLRETQENLVMLLVVGTVTTICGSGNTLSCLLTEPDRYRRLVAGEFTASEAVAESLRYQPPVHFVPRFCKRDTVLEGVALPRGSSIHVCLASANRDKTMFDDPDTWSPGRADLQRTFAFGYGRHGCVGGLLGEAEIVELVTALARRCPDLRLCQSVADPMGWVFRRPDKLVTVLGRRRS